MFRLFSPLLFLMLLLSPVFSASALAEQSQSLTWDNLMPDTAPLQNPLDALPADLWEAFNDINYWKRLQQGPLDQNRRAELKDVEKKAEKALGVFAAKGVEPDVVFKEQEKYLDEIEKRGKLVVREYDGKQVAISGYLLPLNFSETGGDEFLLVPYVGACIHVPPPPPNQMIYVKADKSYKVDLFEPVTVSGTLNIEAISKKLSLVDGSEVVDAGYKMQAGSIMPYSDPEKGK